MAGIIDRMRGDMREMAAPPTGAREAGWTEITERNAEGRSIVDRMMEGMSEMDSETEIADDVVFAPDDPEGVMEGAGETEEIADDVVFAPDDPGGDEVYGGLREQALMERRGAAPGVETPPVMPPFSVCDDPHSLLAEYSRLQQVFMSMSEEDAIEFLSYIMAFGYGRYDNDFYHGAMGRDEYRRREISDEEADRYHERALDFVKSNRRSSPQELAWWSIAADAGMAMDAVPPGTYEMEFGAEFGDPIPAVLTVGSRRPTAKQMKGGFKNLIKEWVRDGAVHFEVKRGVAVYAMENMADRRSYEVYVSKIGKADRVSGEFEVFKCADPNDIAGEMERVMQTIDAMDDETALDLATRIHIDGRGADRGQRHYDQMRKRMSDMIDERNTSDQAKRYEGGGKFTPQMAVKQVALPYVRSRVDGVEIGTYDMGSLDLEVVEKIPGKKRWAMDRSGPKPVLRVKKGNVALALQSGRHEKMSAGVGSSFPIEGVMHEVVERDEGGVVHKDGKIFVPRGSNTGAEMKNYLMALAYERLRHWSDHYAAKLGKTYRYIYLSDDDMFREALGGRSLRYRGTVGLCIYRDRKRETIDLAYQWRLILAHPKYLEYLAAHECAHLVYGSHGPKFWATVKKIMPDYEQYETRDTKIWAGVKDYNFG